MKKIFNKLKTLDSSLWIALSAMLISICALFVSIQEVRIMREQHRLSMLPYLSVSMYYNGEGFGARLKNSGTGIAKVQAYKISKDGQVFSDWIETLRHLYPDNTTLNYNVISANYIEGDMILPAEEVILFGISWADAPPGMEEKIRTLDFKICYASLLNEYWIIENGEQRALTRPCEVE